MHETHFPQVDLNLLHILQALLEERHVTRAGNRCFLSQSAMSRAFERLREMFKDDLLIRTGRTYQRTVRGERLLRNDAPPTMLEGCATDSDRLVGDAFHAWKVF